QAEDGIRDDLVTGVQTCALPILLDIKVHSNCLIGKIITKYVTGIAVTFCPQAIAHVVIGIIERAGRPIERVPDMCHAIQLIVSRSEERRVGKECQYGWARDVDSI